MGAGCFCTGWISLACWQGGKESGGYASRIAPTTPGQAISAVKARRLFQAIRDILALAVERGGTTLRDFSNALGVNGHFQHAAQVYGRAGQACHACSQPIQLLRQGQRSSYYCPRCQKTP